MVENYYKSGRTVLIVDDDKDDLSFLQDAFSENNYQEDLILLKDGREVMDYLHSIHDPALRLRLPSLIILDLNMPGKNGLETLTEIKSSSLYRNIPVIIMSTSKREEDIRKTYSAGASCYIVKPVRFEELVKLIEKISEFWLQSDLGMVL